MNEQPLDLEKLREEIVNMVDYWNEDTSLMRNEGIEAIMRKVEQHVKAACEFYLRYKDKPELFAKEQSPINWKFHLKTQRFVIRKKDKYVYYNYWLFRKVFGSVFSKEEAEEIEKELIL